MKVGYVLFVIAAIYAILRPDDTTVVANWLGVDRGADLIEYALVIAFLFTTLSAYMRFKDLELRYAQTGARGRVGGCAGARGALGSGGPGSKRPGQLSRKNSTVLSRHRSARPSASNPAPSFGPADVQAGPPQVAEPRRVKLRLVRRAGGRGDR